MFSGIIETTGKVESLLQQQGNLEIEISASFDENLYVDQSIAHNGVCLTVTEISQNGTDGNKCYKVTAIPETLKKTNLGTLKVGQRINLERSLKAGQRLDGHFVQGHADTTATLEEIREEGGSHILKFSFSKSFAALIVPKGSICVNGISLTVVKAGKKSFTVAIIPYTWEHTNLGNLVLGDSVNLEFDILGKYILRSLDLRKS